MVKTQIIFASLLCVFGATLAVFAQSATPESQIQFLAAGFNSLNNLTKLHMSLPASAAVHFSSTFDLWSLHYIPRRINDDHPVTIEFDNGGNRKINDVSNTYVCGTFDLRYEYKIDDHLWDRINAGMGPQSGTIYKTESIDQTVPVYKGSRKIGTVHLVGSALIVWDQRTVLKGRATVSGDFTPGQS